MSDKNKWKVNIGDKDYIVDKFEVPEKTIGDYEEAIKIDGDDYKIPKQFKPFFNGTYELEKDKYENYIMGVDFANGSDISASPCEGCPNNKPNQVNVCHCTLCGSSIIKIKRKY